MLGILNKIPTPVTVLDIGPGFGKYGLLLREWLDIRRRRYSPIEWRAVIDCVEIFPAYITGVHEHVYNDILIGDIREVIAELGVYDLLVMSEIIEHLPKEEGTALLKTLWKHHCKSAIVVGFPPVLGNEHIHWSNPNEEHLCIWEEADFTSIFGASATFPAAGVCHLRKE